MKRAFTLVELLIVISIIGLLATIVVPSLVHARLLGYQTRCAANQRDVIQACMIYAQDATVHRGTMSQALPAMRVTSDSWPVMPSDNDPDTPDGNAGCLWLLVSREYTAREVFLCPKAGSSHNWEAPGRGATGFSRDAAAGTTTLSYSYLSQAPYVHNGSTYSATPVDQASSSLVILADKNPYLTLEALDADPVAFAAEAQASVENHDGRGRNVGKLDGSATWVESVTVNGDNIYQSANTTSNPDGIRDEMNDSFCLP